ncbi:MAG: hypothetical protein EOO63_07265, partial [Hymenobacter sp.]
MLLLQNTRIASENSPELTEGDVLIVEGKIQDIGPKLAIPEGARVIDARGRVLMPGMFDAHVHFRAPGFENKETITTGSEAAINGGITARSDGFLGLEAGGAEVNVGIEHTWH